MPMTLLLMVMVVTITMLIVRAYVSISEDVLDSRAPLPNFLAESLSTDQNLQKRERSVRQRRPAIAVAKFIH